MKYIGSCLININQKNYALQLFDRFNDDYGNIAVNNYNLNVINIKPPAAVVKLKRDIGIQYNVDDITDSKLEIPEFSKIHSGFKKSVETGIDDIQNVRKQRIKMKQCFI